MPAKENKERFVQFVKEINECKGDIARIRYILEKYCAPGYISHHARIGDMNLDQEAHHFAEIWAAFPDLIVSIDDMIAEEKKFAARVTLEGVHKGAYMGIPATGKQIKMTAWQFIKMVEGKSVEVWELPDGLGMMSQLGVVPGAVPAR